MVAQLSNRFGLGGIGVNRGTEFRKPQAISHSDRDFRDHVSSIFGNNRCPDDFVSPFFGVYFYETVNATLQDRAINVFERLNIGVDFDSGFFRIRRIHANVRNLW